MILPHLKGRRQRHAQKARKPVRAARRVLGVVDRRNRLARPHEQGFARVRRGNLARCPREGAHARNRVAVYAIARETEG